MVVLMSGQGRPPCEGLLAVGKGTLVWSLAGVDAPVPGERAGIAEWLRSCEFTWTSVTRESLSYLTTPLALVRLLTSMHTLVNSECRSLDELFAAVREVTDMGADTAVNPLMPSKITAPCKCFSAGTAGIGLRSLCGIVGGSVDNSMR
jgi:hypothetical protein